MDVSLNMSRVNMLDNYVIKSIIYSAVAKVVIKSLLNYIIVWCRHANWSRLDNLFKKY